jgi:hypothetical protein
VHKKALTASTVVYCVHTYLLKIRLNGFKLFLQAHTVAGSFVNADFKLILQTYKKMYQLIEKINEAHGFKLLLNTLNDFVAITNSLYIIFKTFMASERSVLGDYVFLLALVLLVVHMAKITVTCYVAHTTMIEVFIIKQTLIHLCSTTSDKKHIIVFEFKIQKKIGQPHNTVWNHRTNKRICLLAARPFWCRPLDLRACVLLSCKFVLVFGFFELCN